MNTEQRARFEALFPVPDGIFYYEQFGKYRAADPANQWSIAMVLSNKFTGFQAAETPLLARIAELERQLANHEPFVVKRPEVFWAYNCGDTVMLAEDVDAAITAAGGVCE